MNAEREREEAEDQALLERFRKALEAIHAGTGESGGEVSCPNCAGRLRWSRSRYNGHLRVCCSTPGCVSFIQ